MSGYHLTKEAKEDLMAIMSFTLEQWGREQSVQYLGRIRSILKDLSKNPMMGRQRPELGDDIFSFPQGNHMIYYTVDDKKRKLIVMACLHQSMVPQKHLKKRSMT